MCAMICRAMLCLCCAASCCSRCTGYRPILDAFKVFAKSEPAAYTAEAIAAAKGMAAATAADDAGGSNGSNGRTNGSNGSSGMVCPSSGLPCDCGGSAAAAAAPAGECAAAGGGCCGSNGSKAANGAAAAAAAVADVKPSSEPIFPKELKGRVPAALKLEGEQLEEGGRGQCWAVLQQ